MNLQFRGDFGADNEREGSLDWQGSLARSLSRSPVWLLLLLSAVLLGLSCFVLLLLRWSHASSRSGGLLPTSIPSRPVPLGLVCSPFHLSIIVSNNTSPAPWVVSLRSQRRSCARGNFTHLHLSESVPRHCR